MAQLVVDLRRERPGGRRRELRPRLLVRERRWLHLQIVLVLVLPHLRLLLLLLVLLLRIDRVRRLLQLVRAGGICSCSSCG